MSHKGLEYILYQRNNFLNFIRDNVKINIIFDINPLVARVNARAQPHFTRPGCLISASAAVHAPWPRV